jgi:hypothetical protein
MVGNCHPLLASAKEAAGRMRKNMTPRTSHKGEKQNHALEKCIAAANRGWMSEKFLPPADQGKCFYLTSPFIEPAEGPGAPSAWTGDLAGTGATWQFPNAEFRFALSCVRETAMQTTIELPEPIYRQGEQLARLRGVTVAELTIRALERELFAAETLPVERKRVNLPLVPSKQPGVLDLRDFDLDDLLA